MSTQDLGTVLLHFSKSNPGDFNSLRGEQKPLDFHLQPIPFSFERQNVCWEHCVCSLRKHSSVNMTHVALLTFTQLIQSCVCCTAPVLQQSCLWRHPNTPSHLPYSQPLSMADSRNSKHGDKLNFGSLMLRVSPEKSRRVSWKAHGAAAASLALPGSWCGQKLATRSSPFSCSGQSAAF